MPYRIQQIEDIVKQLENGDLKLRVRVLEVISFISRAFLRLLRNQLQFTEAKASDQ